MTSKPSDAEMLYRAKIAALGGQYGEGDDLDPRMDAKAYAEAIREAVIRMLLRRAGEQLLPSKLVDMLPVREAEYGVVPGPNDSIATRRAVLVARAKVPRGSSLINMNNALRDLLGDDFVRIKTREADDPSESVDWPTNLGDQPMNLQRPDVPLKLVRLLDPVVTLGTELTIQYELASGPALLTRAQELAAGDVLVVSPETLGMEERVTVIAAGQSEGPNFLRAIFTKAHDAGCLGTTQPFPMWTTTRRTILIVLKAAAAIDPEKRRKVHELMARIARGVTQWSIVQETFVGPISTFGPFVLDQSPLDATPFTTEV